LKNFALLIIILTVFLSGCNEKQAQPSTTPAAETSATSLDSTGDISEKAEPKAEAPQEGQTKTPAKENSQSDKIPTQVNDNLKETATSQKDSSPTAAPAKVQGKTTATVTESAPVVAKPTAPSPPPAKETPIEEKKAETVQLSIRGDKEMGVILSPTQAKYEAGDTVLKVLARTLKEKKIPMEYSGSGGMAYVEGIANLYEFDRGPTSGWMFRVNGGFASKSAGSVTLQPGDQIEWLYTLDMGKDIGAKP